MERKALFDGSSKIFYSNNDESYLMTFKDAIHGWWMQSTIKNTGELRKTFTYYFYRHLEKNWIQTHLYWADALREEWILVKKVLPVKIEILVRNVARWHWVDEHKIPLFEGGIKFDTPIVEFCLKERIEKNDGSIIDDPRINTDVALALNKYSKLPSIKWKMVQSPEEWEKLKTIALKINEIYNSFMQENNWILEDFKFEVWVYPWDQSQIRDFVLIDEISPDCSRIRDTSWNSLSKDLFRQKKSPEEIYQGYEKLTLSIKNYEYERN